MVGADNSLVEMEPTPFALEADFQNLLADHPALLRLAAGISGDLLLVSQEYGIADGEGGSDRWNIDHLYLTRDAVPVLVEVKRASDTRGRREVVAQMLDYASHGTAFWSGSDIAARFQRTATAQGIDADQRLQDFLNEADAETFWRQVQANLRSGRIRMVFVSDSIGKELRRIVEWLNEQLRSAEVLAIEISQFSNANGVRTLVPQLVGATERAESAKAVTALPVFTSDEDWISAFEATHGPEAGARARQLIDVVQALGLLLRRAATAKSLSFRSIDSSGKERGIVYLYESGIIEVAMGYFPMVPGLNDDAWRVALLDRLRNLVPSLKVPAKGIDGYPRLGVGALLPDDTWEGFKSILEDICQRLRSIGHDQPTDLKVISTL